MKKRIVVIIEEDLKQIHVIERVKIECEKRIVVIIEEDLKQIHVIEYLPILYLVCYFDL